MDDRDLTTGEGGAPTLVSLALFAVIFFSALLVVEFGSDLIEPFRAALAGLPASLKAGTLAAVILGLMAIARIAALLGFGANRAKES
ncbi:hypothetical protein [Maricaulis sp.]|uniref:hypothetical protein n=1 Tax=Maricaulis sp. TaxID=1486257 RepID=UPI001B1270D3|nr:hypothetical protein [Maricaulis sp.]MBO6763982.1 hypothetical protein [Maricaulis sp.]